MLKIDIKARVFSKEDKAYRIFPGPNYKHYQVMRDNSVVFLDFPGMPFPSKAGYPKDQATLADLVKSERRALINLARYNDSSEKLSEINNLDQSTLRWSRRREQILQWWNNLYLIAKPGDLVVMPCPQRLGPSESEYRTKVGEIVGHPERWNSDAPDIYRPAGMLVRRVKWLADVAEHDLEPKTMRALRTQNPLVLLPAEQLRPVLGAAYKNVVLNNEFLARFITNGNDVARESYHFQAFVLTVIEAYNRSQEASKRPLEESIYQIAASVRKSDAKFLTQNVSIHSPGYSTLHSPKSVVFVIAALFSAALAKPSEAFDSQGNPAIVLANSESASYDPCSPQGLEDHVNETFKIIQYDRWKEMCAAATAANSEDGFEPISSAEVIKDGDPR